MKTPIIIVVCLLALFILWISFSYFAVASIESIPYTVIEEHNDYEIRKFDDHLVAEVTVTGTYDEATNLGFTKIADFIFGNNTSSEKVAMTTPVINNSEKIAMTTPVVNTEGADQTWTISFVMPSEYTLESLPTPNNDDVQIREVKGETVAALRFSWWATQSRFDKKTNELLSYLERDGLEVSNIQTARFNPPLTAPFMLRNEVWAILK